MLDIHDTGGGHGDKWECLKCHTWNENRVTRCSWCSAPKLVQGTPVPGNDLDARITQLLHNTIEKMSYPQKVKCWKLLEDNVI